MNGRDHYATLGRWFVAHANRDDIEISLAPLYVNQDGHPADPSKARFAVPAKPLPHGAFYEPHTRQFWPGISKPQEFESTTFSNNAGYIDRDRFFDNPDNCYRVVHLGSSNAVALQVRPFEKYNMVMESELAVRLQRCVEVISAGRDNGDIGSNYARIRHYAIQFNPAAILIENSSSLMMQLTPLLLKKTVGWDHTNNALDNFYYDAEGRLQFRPGVQDYGVYASKPDSSPLLPGVPLHLTLQIPFDLMPKEGQEAYRYLGDIMAFLAREHPEQKFVLHTSLDEVTQCRKQCTIPLQLPDGRSLTAGASVFVANMREFCATRKLQCLFPAGADEFRTLDRYLTFEQDAHYSVLGHQWLAGEFSRFLLEHAGGASDRVQR
jgi:hypothetical protein